MSFDQVVPFHAGKVIDINRTVTAGSHTVTLERAVIAPSTTRFFFKNARPGDHFTLPTAWVNYTLSAEGKTYGGETYTPVIITESNEPLSIEFWTDLRSQTGSWILQINSSEEGGAFTFTFTVS